MCIEITFSCAIIVRMSSYFVNIFLNISNFSFFSSKFLKFHYFLKFYYFFCNFYQNFTKFSKIYENFGNVPNFMNNDRTEDSVRTNASTMSEYVDFRQYYVRPIIKTFRGTRDGPLDGPCTEVDGNFGDPNVRQ